MKVPRISICATLALTVLGACSSGAESPEGGSPASQAAPQGADAPEARGYALMAPSADGAVLLIGGFDCPACDPSYSGFGDMWALDPSATWAELSPAMVPPGADDFAFDTGSGRGVYVEVGGATWAYDPVSNAWDQLELEDVPAALHGSKMVYDEGSDRVILFGGDDFSPTSLHDQTWAFDLEARTWEERDPSRRPPARTYYAMAYDAGSDRVILFGGGGPGRRHDDTWAYDYESDTWERMSPRRSPPARVYANAAYDAASDRVIMYGGSVDEEVAAFQDTWAYDYDSDAWTKLADTAPIGEIAWHAMASSPEGVVLFGGGVTRDDYVADAWLFDPVEATWNRIGAP